MPIIQVTTSVDDQVVHRALADALTKSFVTGGARADHISTVFDVVSRSNVYAGPTAMDELHPDRDFAFVRVHLSSQRGVEFRRGLVAAVVDALAGRIDPAHVSIDFIQREAVNAFIGKVPMSSQDRIPDIARSAENESFEALVRSLLANFWGQHVVDARADALLLDLVPDPMQWDSLQKAELALNLETDLGLPSNSLDVGSEDVRLMFSDRSTLADLIGSLSAIKAG